MKNAAIFLAVSVMLVVASVMLVACGNGGRGVLNSKYVFYNITFGNAIVDENDTLETIKAKILAEFPQMKWNEISPFGDSTNLEIDANVIYDRVFKDRRVNYIRINGSRLNVILSDTAHWLGSISEVNNRRFRLNYYSGIDIRIRGNYNDGFRNQWRGTGLNYEKGVIFHTEGRIGVEGIMFEFRINYKIK